MHHPSPQLPNAVSPFFIKESGDCAANSGASSLIELASGGPKVIYELGAVAAGVAVGGRKGVMDGKVSPDPTNRAGDVSEAYPLFQGEGDGSIPTSALALRFFKIDRDTFRSCNQSWHSRLPLIGASQFRVCYGALFGDRWFAVAAWSNPVARLLPQLTWLELRRFAIAPTAPKNTASRMLGWMARDIRKAFSDVVRLISYQDLTSHKGTIYKSAGWKHAEGYKPRARGWEPTTNWASRHRAGRTNQAVSPRMRWELSLSSPTPEGSVAHAK